VLGSIESTNQYEGSSSIDDGRGTRSIVA